MMLVHFARGIVYHLLAAKRAINLAVERSDDGCRISSGLSLHVDHRRIGALQCANSAEDTQTLLVRLANIGELLTKFLNLEQRSTRAMTCAVHAIAHDDPHATDIQ